MTTEIDIFEVLKRVDSFDIAFFENLTEDQKKGISPYTLMLWMAGCKSKIQLQQLNVFLNFLIFELPPGHNDLLYKLACISSDGKRKKYNWIKKASKNKSFPVTVGILCRHYQCSKSEALEYVPLVDYDFVKNIAMAMGEQEDTMKKIKKELK